MGLLSRLLRRDDLDVEQLTAAVAAVDDVRGVELAVRETGGAGRVQNRLVEGSRSVGRVMNQRGESAACCCR